MECSYCGRILEINRALKFGKKYFCSDKCMKLYNFFLLEDKMINYCYTWGNHCGICPIEQECAIFLKVEKQIFTDDDVLKFNIPIMDELK